MLSLSHVNVIHDDINAKLNLSDCITLYVSQSLLLKWTARRKDLSVVLEYSLSTLFGFIWISEGSINKICRDQPWEHFLNNSWKCASEVQLQFSSFPIKYPKKLSTYSFASDDPCVYEPVCYEMLVGKEYYAEM